MAYKKEKGFPKRFRDVAPLQMNRENAHHTMYQSKAKNKRTVAVNKNGHEIMERLNRTCEKIFLQKNT